MSDGTDLLEVLQADVAAVLTWCPGLNGANVLADNEGDIENRTLRALGTRGSGLVIIVLRPEVVSSERNLPGPQMKVEIKIQVIEQVLVNRDATNGTGMRSSQAALRVLAALHLHNLGKQVLYSDRDPVKAVPTKAGYVSHAVILYAQNLSLAAVLKTAAVSATVSTLGSPPLPVIVLSCATGGSEINYTQDGTFPTPGRATLYNPTTALPMPEVGTVIRAVAYSDLGNPSDVLEFTVTP